MLYLPTALLDASFQTPSPWTSCASGCPDNAFQLGSEPAFLGDVVVPVREVLTMLLFLAVTVRLGQRVVRATPITRLTLLPVLVVAATRCAVFALALGVRRVSPGSPLVEPLVWVIALAVPALAVAFLVGLLQRRLYAGGALQQLGAAARGALDRDQLRVVLSKAVGDPTLEVVYRGDARRRWVDARGTPMGPAGARPGTLPDRGPRGRAARGGARPRRRPARPGGLPPGGGVLRADRAREQTPDRAGGGVTASRCASRGPASWPAATASGAGSSATCTTVRSSGWWRWGSSSS